MISDEKTKKDLEQCRKWIDKTLQQIYGEKEQNKCMRCGKPNIGYENHLCFTCFCRPIED